MEREFLQGVDFRLFVDETTYESWLNLLKGLVMTKERESHDWRYSRSMPHGSILPPPLATTSRVYESGPPRKTSLDPSSLGQSQRARSSSPLHSFRTAYPFTFAVPPSTTAAHVQQSPAHLSPNDPSRPGAKRTAADAFSPTSASFTHLRPSKRPVSLSLDIGAVDGVTRSPCSASAAATGMYTPTSMESLQSFERLSLHGPASARVGRPEGSYSASSLPLSAKQSPSRTLVAPYRLEDTRHLAAPQVCSRSISLERDTQVFYYLEPILLHSVVFPDGQRRRLLCA